jgi:hypothetical protein
VTNENEGVGCVGKAMAKIRKLIAIVCFGIFLLSVVSQGWLDARFAIVGVLLVYCRDFGKKEDNSENVLR